MDKKDLIKRAINSEMLAVSELHKSVDDDYVRALDILKACDGKVIFSGVGKSGHIGKKLAATFASTGTPAFFLHSDEGLHGDLGMVNHDDVVVLITNSGETSEVKNMLPSLERIGCKKILISSKKTSTVGNACDAVLAYSYSSEADHLNLAPTVSSLLSLVIGDALAVTLSEMRGFKKENFLLYHPGGSLGSQLEDELKEA
ncbi:SIS domain-containing protein [Acidaminobacter sp. JC074]|uniref:KpsF/GutQ family sugar-phosphate isomerase n=1 Tax=Acidaminobacter sp. JC074 TaxID=2530199 RepID=UPI001F101F18|nr:SIS domain-containing protein [Acidaminobacter sp. JC074]MCH4886572.1 SIS domain-containing protein [Acidaminobacter sp. JC074]